MDSHHQTDPGAEEHEPLAPIPVVPALHDPSFAKMPVVEDPSFWRCAISFDGAVTSRIANDVLIIGLIALGWYALFLHFPKVLLGIGPVEVAGGGMGLVLVFRTNAGYDRWYEGRKMWGDITNASRNLVQTGLAYGPRSTTWRNEWVNWCASFPHVCRLSLRDQRHTEDLERLLGHRAAAQTMAAAHMPSYVAFRMACLLKDAAQVEGVRPEFLLTMEQERQSLVDAIGGCERIASTPLPRVYVLKFRSFLAIYLCLLPAAMVDEAGWSTPLLAMLVAYPAFGLDRIAAELQAPFRSDRLSHLPLDRMCAAIEYNSLELLRRDRHRATIG